jgi:hypothetical protein
MKTVLAMINGKVIYTRVHKGYLSDTALNMAVASSVEFFEKSGFTVIVGGV